MIMLYCVVFIELFVLDSLTPTCNNRGASLCFQHLHDPIIFFVIKFILFLVLEQTKREFLII